MQHKILSILGILFILQIANQCNCTKESSHDLVNVDLRWNGPHPIDLSSGPVITNATKGLSCWVPGENAGYFINAADGKTYKFTQEGDKLECQASGILSPFTIEKSFVFAVGLKQQNLYLGTLHGSQITIHQLEEGNWRSVLSMNIATFFSGSSIQEDKHVVGCTLLRSQPKGCIMFILQNGQKGQKTELGCLLFDPTQKKLTKVNVSAAYAKKGMTHNNTYLIGALGVKPDRVLLAKGYPDSKKFSYDVLGIEADTLTQLYFKNNSSTIPTQKATKPGWELFPMEDIREKGIPIPIFVLADEHKRNFYRLAASGDLKSITSPDLDKKKPSLVVCLGAKLYLITTGSKPTTNEEPSDEQQQQEEGFVYYQAQLCKGEEDTHSNSK
jgi:hypothetical protein